MPKQIIIYGVAFQAQQLYEYIRREKEDVVAAFTADRGYIRQSYLFDLPVVEFETLEKRYPPEQYEILISFAYSNMMRNREEKFLCCKQKGYRHYSFLSDRANIYSAELGEGSIIYPGCTLAPFTRLGDGNFLEIGVNIAHHSRAGSFNFFAPSSSVCGDVTIGNHCFFGTGSVARDSISVADYTVLGAGVYLGCSTREKQVFKPQRPVLLEQNSDEIKL